MITKDENIEFLKSKIAEIKLAKFSADTDSLLRLPNNIITTLKVDNEGNIWFFTSCTGTYASNITDKNFYATLEYYHKGNDCRLHIDGVASIVEEEDGAQPFSITRRSNNGAYNIVLVKLKIVRAECFESKHIFATSLKETIRNIYTQLFYPNAFKQFEFFESAPNDLSSF